MEVVNISDTKKSGIQYNGNKLYLNGQAPHKLNIGAPSSVNIQYQVNPIDLDCFVKSKTVSRLTLDI